MCFVYSVYWCLFFKQKTAYEVRISDWSSDVCSADLLSNYVLPTSASGAGTITPAEVQVVGILANDKVYDGTTAATLDSSGGGLTGVFGGDTVTLVSGGASGAFATKNVGTDIPVTATGYAISGADAGNYTVLQPFGLMADITEATLQIA